MSLKKISEFEWEIPISEGMNVPGRIFSSDNLIKEFDDKCLEQVRNVASLPGILKGSFGMPDMHLGYGFPVGGVAAFDVDSGVISPGGVGYDINCSVRLLKTNLVEKDLKGREREIVRSLFRSVPSGVGRGGKIKLSAEEIDGVLEDGARWAVSNGYGFEDDLRHIEDEGRMDGADSSAVSVIAKKRGMNQLGTLGAGNHFLDLLVVGEVFDKRIAKVFGLEMGQVVIMIHCGSRGLGHQVASDYIEEMADSEGADVGLANAPIKSELGKKYFGAMAAAANFAFANKQVITHFVRESMKHYFSEFKAEVVYDICHNIAKFEKHDGREVLVVRKGATRSFGPGREEVPKDYREVGQPVLLPGSMGSASYVLAGTRSSEEKSWGSSAHGAGRVRSRREAYNVINFEDAKKDMEKRGVFVEFGKRKGMIEESPFSYKDVDEVVRVLHEGGLGKKVLKMKPILVVIG